MKRTVLSLCLSFLAMLSIQAATLEVLKVDFENVPADSLPAGWTQEFVQLPVTQSANSKLYSWGVEEGDSLTFPAGCVSGTHRMKAANTTNQEMRFVTRLITPPINLTGVFRPQLIFSHAEPARAAFSDTLRVYYFDSRNSVWKPLPEAEYTREANWRETTLSLPSTSALSSYRIAFEITESMGRGVVLDDIIVRATPTCQTVENITFTQIHANDVTILWDDFGAFNFFEVMVANEELDLQNIDSTRIVANLTEDIYDPSVTVRNLKPETTYYVYVRSDCDETESGYTEWVGASFRTRKLALLPYSEAFNSSITIPDNVAYGVPDGWSVGNNLEGVLPMIVRGNSVAANALYSVDSTAYLGFVGEMSTTPTPIPASAYVYAATPEVRDPQQLGETSLRGLEVQFWVTPSSFVSLGTKNYASELIIGTMSDPEDIRTFTPYDTVHITGTNLFRHVSVNFADYSGSDKYVALLSRSRMANAMFVDNFSMSMPQAYVPDNIVLTNVTSTGFTVTPSLHGADSWDLMVSSEYSRTGNVSDASILNIQNNLTGKNAVVNSASLTNQIVHVYARAHKGGEQSEWSFAKTIRVPGLMPVLTDSTHFTLSFEGGNDLQLNLLDQESRFPNSVRGTSTLYYPLGTIDSINTYPMCVSSAPNYSGHGSHMQFCGSDTWFVLPEATDLNTLKMVFRHSSLNNLRGKLAIGVMSDPYDLSTFEQVAQFEAVGARYVRCLVSFDNYTGSGKYIAFRSLNAGSGRATSTNLIDEIVVSKLGSCREASNVAVNAHDTYADVVWNGGGMDTWIVALASDASMMNTLSLDTVHTPNIRFSNLEQEHTYYFYIQTVCGGQPLDLDDVCYIFTTPRGLPIKESFLNSSMPAGWTQSTKSASSVFSGAELTTSTSRPWSFSNSSSYVNAPMSGYVAYATLYNYSYDYSWLISPELYVDADPDKPLELVFDLGMATYVPSYSSSTYSHGGEAAPNDWFMVAVSEDGGNTWLRENATVWNNTGTGDYVLNNLIWDGGEKVAIDFTKYIGKHIKFAFYLEATTTTYRDYLVIDNIILREGDDRCGGLSNLRAYAPNVNAANVTWQLAGQNPWPAVVQISSSANFATLFANDTVQGSSKSYTGLEPSTAYYVRARQLCTNDSEWKQATFRTPCTAISPEAFGFENFDSQEALGCWTVGLEVEKSPNDMPHRAQVNGFGNVLDMSKTSADTTASDGAYAILPEFALDDNVKDISHYQIIFKAATNSNAENNIHQLMVGIVSDPTDMSATWSLQADIDLQYAEDSTGMKTYVVSFENYRGDIDGYMGHYVAFRADAGTDNTNFVIIDDVMITDAEGCHMVIDLAADSLTNSSAYLHWSGNGSQYELGLSLAPVDPDTFDAWFIHETLSETHYYTNNLESSTRYYAYVRAICGDTATGRWSSATYFNTRRGGVPYIETFDDVKKYLSEVEISHASGNFTGNSVTITPQPSQATSYSGGWRPVTVGEKIPGMSEKAVAMDMYGGYAFWLVLPTFDLRNVLDEKIRFSAKVALTKYSSYETAPYTGSGNNDRLGVLVSFDGGKTWNKKDAKFWAMDGSGDYVYDFNQTAKRIELDLSEYVGDSITIAILGEDLDNSSTSLDNDLVIDSIRLEKIGGDCLGIRQATFELNGENSAVARWHASGATKDVEYVLSDESDFATFIVKDTTALDSVVFTNLEFGHTYYLRLTQANCNSGSVSLQVSTLSAIPFVESFNVQAIPATWTQMTGNADLAVAGSALPTLDPDPSWEINTTSIGLPANHLSGTISKKSDRKNDWIVSPDVMIPSGSEDVKLMFDLALTSTSTSSSEAPSTTATHEFRVLVSTDQGASWTHQWIFKDEASAYMRMADIPATGTRIELPMDAFVGERVRFAFYKDAQDKLTKIHIANVQLREMGSFCEVPTDVQVDDVQFSTAVVSWNADASKAYIVEYSAMADFTNAKRDTVYSTLTDTLKNLRSGTSYFVRVQKMCDASGISDFSESRSLKTDIGLPYYNALNDVEAWGRYQSPFADGLSGTRTAVVANIFGWKNQGGTTILSGNHVYCGNSADQAYWLISPAINLSQLNPETIVLLQLDLALTLDYKTATAPTADGYASENKFYVAVSVDGGETYLAENAIEFSASDTADYSYADIPAGAGDTYRMDFSRFIGNTIRIALVSMAPRPACINAARLSLDEAASACFGVSKMQIADIDTAATVTLTPMDNAHRWQLAYGVQGTSMDKMQKVVVDSTVARIGGLLLNSTYAIQARSICSEGDTSQWMSAINFETPQGIPYTAAFNDSFDDWSRYTGNPDSVFAGADTLSPATSGWSKTSSSSYALGQPHIYCAQSSTKANWLVSPEINLMPQDGSKGIWLSMKAALTSTYSSSYSPTNVTGHTFRVAVTEDGGATWQEDNSILWSGDTLTADYIYSSIPAGAGKAIHVNLVKHAGKKVRIALIQGSATAGSSCIHIADLEFAEYDVPCFGVDNFQAVNDGNIAHCTITDDNEASTAWQYVYGKSGFDPDTAQAITTTTKLFDINELPMSSTIDIYVRAICGTADTTSWVGPQSVVTPNGVPYFQSFTSSSSLPTGWSGDWSIGKGSYVWGVDHAFVNIYTSSSSSSSTKNLKSPEINLYNINSDIDLSFDLALTKWNTSGSPTSTAGQSFEVQISTDQGSTYETLAVWSEDYDADYVYANIPITGETYHVDLTEYIGESVTIRFQAKATISGADNDLHIRNVLVDTVSSGATICPKVRSMTVLDTTFHSVTVIFRGKGVGEAMAIEYKCIPEDGLFPTYPALVSDTDVVVVDGLSSSSKYKMFARQQCPDSSWGVWCGPFYFNTVECRPITGITVQEVTNTDAVLTLVTPAATAALGYQACLVPEGEPISNVQTFNTATIHFVQDMPSNAIYDVYARKICEVGDTSEWRGPFHVYTPLGVPFFAALTSTSTASALPDGWDCLEPTTDGGWSSSTRWSMGDASYVWGANHPNMNNYSTYKSMLVSPQINTNEAMLSGYLDLSFDMALTGWNKSAAPTNATNQTVEVRVSTDGGNTFDEVVAVWGEGDATYSYADIPTTGERYHLDLSQYIGQSIRVGFYAQSFSGAGDNDVHIRNVQLDTTSVRCEAVNNLSVSSIELNAAKVSFEFPDGAPSGNAYIEVALDNEFLQLVVADQIIGQPEYRLTNLSPSTVYYVRVKNMCDFGDALWSTITFATQYGVRFTERFESDASFRQWTFSETPLDTVFRYGTLTTIPAYTSSYVKWARCVPSSHDHSTIFPTQHVEIDMYSSGKSAWLISPAIDLSQNVGDGLLLSLDVALCSYSGGGDPSFGNEDHQLYLVVSEDGGETWQQSNSVSWKKTGGTYDYAQLGVVPQNFMIDMSQYGGKQIKMALCANLVAGGADNFLMVDNIDLNKVITVNYEDTICDYEDYDMHGFHYDAAQLQLGENAYRIISENFDTITYLNIFVGTIAVENVSDTICEGELFTGYGFEDLEATVSGEYKRYIERPGQCDSLLTLHLTVLPKAHIEIFDTLCDGTVYTFKGKAYYNDIILRDTLTSLATGCDSIVTYYITFSGDATSTTDIYAIICAGQRYRDALFSETEAGVYHETTASVAGCDSIVTLHLKVTDENGYFYDTINVEDLPYIYEGEQLIPAGAEAKDYVFPLESVNEDCNPELHVHVWMQTALPNINALQLSVAPNPVQAGEALHIVTDIPAGGEFSATVFNAIGQEVYTVSEFTTELPALYTSGIYMVRVQSGKQLYEGKILVK